jgi:hypothetical protein
MPRSARPLYHVYLSAPIGLFMLCKGNWIPAPGTRAGIQIPDYAAVSRPRMIGLPEVPGPEAEMGDWLWGFGVTWWVLR